MARESIRSLGGELDAIVNTSDLLRSWGFGWSDIPDIIRELESPERPRNVVIDVGTSALDCKHEGNFGSDPNMGGLALIGPDDKDMQTGVIFREPPLDVLWTGHTGGIGNAANAVAPVLRATIEAVRSDPEKIVGVSEVLGLKEAQSRRKIWAVMAWLGGDDVGNIWADKIDPDIDISLLRTHPRIIYKHSGLADIRIQASEFATENAPQGDRAIYFRAGASGATEFTGDYLLEVLKRNPFNAHVSYPGLFPYGADRSNGVNLAWFVREAQRICPCVSMDIHGFTQLKHIEPALPHIDMFNSNFADAVRVFLGKTANENKVDYQEKMRLYSDIANALRTKYFAPEGAKRSRMFTITDKKGVFLIFQDQTAGEIRAEYIPSPCADIPAKDKTGAGDVRFGLQRLYVALSANHDWEMGQFTWEQAKTAVNIGQIGTTLHIQGKEAHALEGVSLDALEKVAKSGEQFTDLSSLQMALTE